MTNPTTNYGFVLPTSTDLVTDLPADFDVALQGVDTQLKALQPGTTLGDIAYSSATANTNTRLGIGTAGQVLAVSGGVPAWTTTADVTPLTTKGDLFTFTTVDARIGVGANNTVLTADSAEATGLKWATPAAAGGMTLLSTTNLSGASTTISITPTGYNQIAVFVSGVTNGSNGNLFMGINADTTAGNYVQAWFGTNLTTYYSGANVGVAGVNAILPGNNGYLGSNSANFAQFMIYDPNGVTKKAINASSAFFSDASNNAASNTVCNYVTTSALSSVQIKTTLGTLTAGTALVYGVK